MQNDAALYYKFNHDIIYFLSLDYIHWKWIKTSAAHNPSMDN